MKGYPPGTKCVITWTDHHPASVARLGDIVTCRSFVGPDCALPGKLIQQIGPEAVVRGYVFIPAWPVDWMRPLEDPDKIEQPEQFEVSER